MKSEIWFFKGGPASDNLKLVFMKSEIPKIECGPKIDNLNHRRNIMQVKVFVNGVLVHRGYDVRYAVGVMKEWQKHNPDAKVKMVGKRIRRAS